MLDACYELYGQISISHGSIDKVVYSRPESENKQVCSTSSVQPIVALRKGWVEAMFNADNDDRPFQVHVNLWDSDSLSNDRVAYGTVDIWPDDKGIHADRSVIIPGCS